jgi:hypothetical protein
MRRLLLAALILGVVFSPGHAAGDFGWTLSESPTEPRSNTGEPVAGVVDIYLWYYCVVMAGGLASAEFDIVGSLLPLSFTPMNGFLNAGTPTSLQLSVGGCPYPPLVAGVLQYFDAAGVGFWTCFGPSSASGWNFSVQCGTMSEIMNGYIGYSSDGSEPCRGPSPYGPCVEAITADSWASVKSLYR